MGQEVDHYRHWLRSARSADKEKDIGPKPWTYSYINAALTLYIKFEEIKGELVESIKAAKAENRKVVLIFNIGSWEKNLCSAKHQMIRDTLGKDELKLTAFAKGEGCLAFYKENMRKLMEFLRTNDDAKNIDMKIFRTTWAAYSKYGNYGFGWPGDVEQLQPTSQHVLKVFHDEAVKIIAEDWYNTHFVDGFAMTYARDEHSKHVKGHAIGDHMAHQGRETVAATDVMWMNLVLGEFCPKTKSWWQKRD